MTVLVCRRLNSLVFFIISFCLISISPAIECGAGTSTARLLNQADNSRKSLYKSAKRMKYRHNWMNSIVLYEKIYKKYPKSKEAPWAMFRAAGMFLKLNKYSGNENDVNTALELYDKVTRDYPEHRLADDAQYRMGNIYYSHKKDMTQAYVEFLKVDIKYPTGDMRPKAAEMMDKLSNLLGEKKEEAPGVENAPSADSFATVVDIRKLSTSTYTRVVIDLDKPTEYTDHLLKVDSKLKKPRRLYLDLKNTKIGKEIESSIPIKDGLLWAARAGQYNQDTVRVVLDIDNISRYRTFRLHDPFRIVVDVHGSKNTAGKNNVKKKTGPAGGSVQKPKNPDKTISLARQLGLTVKRIVIDPGHGGRDPGCLFKGGIKEKDITLSLAKILKVKIEKKLGCEVLLTRTTDVFMPLDERTAFATSKNADLFISLHVNAHKQSNIYGIETYFLNMATDQQAVIVAARENATSEKNISDLQSILKDLMLTTKISESSKLAQMVQNGMIGDVKKKYKPYKNLGVKQAPFYVLVGAEMPAILIETGFITNGTERTRLLSESYKEVLSEGITGGIESYMKSIDQAYVGG